ncbi:hypothetical protein H5410_019966 [Solanum commersonii]|uniref:Reverse transcriptase zinc-binding domain-containing protein n=1 Tax=Solanum commersonii TaxID=4109 RepID=A0A9J5Z8U0_SOLCO|nr:hypothetical protein H5410_019966 [Solanum commersonii]
MLTDALCKTVHPFSKVADGRWSWQADRDSSLFGFRSNEYTAELMEIPTSFLPSKFFIVTTDFEENYYIVKKRTKTVPREVISRCWEVKGVLGAYIKAMKYMYNRAKIRMSPGQEEVTFWDLRFRRAFQDWGVNEFERMLQLLRQHCEAVDRTDSIRWRLGNNGVFPIKSSIPKVPRKVCFFTWLAARRVILTTKNLRKTKLGHETMVGHVKLVCNVMGNAENCERTVVLLESWKKQEKMQGIESCSYSIDVDRLREKFEVFQRSRIEFLAVEE